MKYFVISIQNLKSGSTAQSIFAYDTREEALSVYHSTLASNYISESLSGFCTMVINSHGGTEVREFWDAPVPEPTTV